MKLKKDKNNTYVIMKKIIKETYATPEVEIVELNLEQGFASSQIGDYEQGWGFDFDNA